LIGAGVTFAVSNLCNTHNSGNIARFIYSVFTHKLEIARGKSEGLFKITGGARSLCICRVFCLVMRADRETDKHTNRQTGTYSLQYSATLPGVK